MNWDAIGAMGQVLGSIAVFVTLGYLGMQVRQARSEARSAARQARLGSNREVLLAMVNSPDLLGSLGALDSAMGNEPVGFGRFAMDLGLTAVQAGQLNVFMLAWWEGMETIMATLEHLDADELASFHQRTRAYTVGPWAKWYELNKPFLNPSSVRYIDNLLVQPG